MSRWRWWRIRWTGSLAGAVVLAGAFEGSLCAQTLSWSGTVQYAQGKYIFTEVTRSWSFYSSLAWERGPVRLSLGLPVVMQDSRAITYIGDVPLPTGGPDSEAVGKKTEGEPVPMGGRRGGSGSGISGAEVILLARQTSGTPVDSVQPPDQMEIQVADPILGFGVELAGPRGGFLGLDLSGSVKAPVRGVDSGVGTGEWDFGVGLSTAAGKAPWMVFADVGWWRYGDPPGLELQDVLSYGAGIGLLMGSRFSGLLSLSGTTAPLETADPPAEVGAMLSVALGEGRSLTVGASFGLTESSPDASVSVGTRITLSN